MPLELTVNLDTEKFKKDIDDAAEKYDHAFEVAANMIASMLHTEIVADIKQAGNFDKYVDGLSVTVEEKTIKIEIEAPGAEIFETGGTISGKPLLWLPISGTDAEGVRASDYGSKLFSVNRKAGGVPLLFSVKDRAPKYFGVPSVNIPKKFHIEEIRDRVMEGFPEILKDALNE